MPGVKILIRLDLDKKIQSFVQTISIFETFQSDPKNYFIKSSYFFLNCLKKIAHTLRKCMSQKEFYLSYGVDSTIDTF